MNVYIVWWDQESSTIYLIKDCPDTDFKKLEQLADKFINIDDDISKWICEYLVDKPKVTTPCEINGVIINTGFAL